MELNLQPLGSDSVLSVGIKRSYRVEVSLCISYHYELHEICSTYKFKKEEL